jgi:hypothetical protein
VPGGVGVIADVLGDFSFVAMIKLKRHQADKTRILVLHTNLIAGAASDTCKEPPIALDTKCLTSKKSIVIKAH